MAEEGELEGLTQAHAAGVPAATWGVGRADWRGWGVAIAPQLQVRRGDRVPCVRRAREGGRRFGWGPLRCLAERGSGHLVQQRDLDVMMKRVNPRSAASAEASGARYPSKHTVCLCSV
jgi:hypothetical protein